MDSFERPLADTFVWFLIFSTSKVYFNEMCARCMMHDVKCVAGDFWLN